MTATGETPVETVNRCPYCRVVLDDNGAVLEKGDRHGPDCADRPLEKSELKKLFRSRPGVPKKTETRDPDTGRIVYDAYEVTVEENLKTILDSAYLTSVTVGLLRELAALIRIADANRAATTDREGRYRDVHAPMPSFTPAQAEQRLREAEERLHDEVLLLAGAARNPHDPQKPQCIECGRRGTVLDSFCQPCGARILKAHRR